MMKRRKAGEFIDVPEDEEAAIRAAVTPDGATGPLLENHGPYDVVMSDEEAAALRAERAAFVPHVPNCQPWQMRAELAARGRLADVEALIAKIGGEQMIRWEFDPVCIASSPTWETVGNELGLSFGDIFRAAATRT